jgi:putative SOS response-associated peptidase YedK
MMAVLPHRPRLTPEQREALELLASDPQGATEELLVLAHGFDGDMIAGLVRSGLAMARRENMKAGGRAIEVVRIRITGAGRKALAAEDG